MVLADYWLVCLQVWVFCVVFHDMLSCKMWLVPRANELWETSKAARNWCKQWTTTDLVWCHPPWPGRCRSWSVLSSDFTLQLTQHQRDGDCTKRDSLQPLIKMHSVILSSEMGLFCVKNILYSVFATTDQLSLHPHPDLWIESGLHTPVAWLCRLAGFIWKKMSLAQKTEGVHY